MRDGGFKLQDVMFWGFQALIGVLGTVSCTFLWWIFVEVHKQGLHMAEMTQLVTDTRLSQDSLVAYAKETRKITDDHEVRITVIERTHRSANIPKLPSWFQGG